MSDDALRVHDLIAAQAARTPDAVALIDGEVRLTHAALQARVRRLAWALRAAGVAAEVPVAIGCARSADMIVAVLAVLEAGGAYVPIDPGQPRARVDAILADARVPMILTRRAQVACFAGAAARILAVDDPAVTAGCSPDPLPPLTTADSALYILYTSGSTGQPKGVVTEHRAITSRLLWQQASFGYTADEVASARTPLGFVDSVAEIFAPLAFGVPLVIIGDEAQRDLAQMVEVLAAAAVTRVVVVPSQLATLLELAPELGRRLPDLRWWFVGGEPVPVALVAAFRRALPGRRLVNLYGATEVSGDATAYDFDAMPDGLATSPIGTALWRVHARVVDDELGEVAGEGAGEIVVSGVCLARGYLGQPALTAARFVPNPFPEGGRLYRTGDVGRRLPDGTLQYLGRRDQQVKIRGVRVELGEVEAALQAVAGVHHAVVVAPDDGRGGRVLVGYYTGATGAPEVRAALAAVLPAPMIPERVLALDELPRSPSGKVDRKGLQARPVPAPVMVDGDEPESESERAVAAAWRAALGDVAVGRSHRFQALGGTSLDAARVVARLRERHAPGLALADLAAFPTVAALASRLDALGGGGDAGPRFTVHGGPLPRTLPLSSFQLPFWCFQALTGDVSVVHEVLAVRGDGPLDVEALQRAFADAVAGFDGLWMEVSRARPVQRRATGPRPPARFTVHDHRASRTAAAELLQAHADANGAERFDLTRPPHIHARLVRLPGGDDRLVLAVPHILVDMTALDLFRRRLEGAAVPAAADLRDHLVWERHPGRAGERAAAARHWAEVGTGPATVALPAALFSRRSVRAWSRRVVTAGTSERLAARAAADGASLPLVLVAAAYTAIAHTAGCDDPTVLVMVDRRDRAETRELFTTLTALVRARVAGGRGPVDALVRRLAAHLARSHPHGSLVMQRPTWFNDFWRDAPGPLRRMIRGLSARLAARWPEAQLAPDALAEIVFAIVPWPRRMRRRAAATRDLLVCINVLPEVYLPPAPSGGALRLRRVRTLTQMVRPSDLITGADRLLDRTLQIHVLRDDGGPLTVNLYGGGLTPAALEAINDRVMAALTSYAEVG